MSTTYSSTTPPATGSLSGLSNCNQINLDHRLQSCSLQYHCMVLVVNTIDPPILCMNVFVYVAIECHPGAFRDIPHASFAQQKLFPAASISIQKNNRFIYVSWFSFLYYCFNSMYPWHLIWILLNVLHHFCWSIYTYIHDETLFIYMIIRSIIYYIILFVVR